MQLLANRLVDLCKSAKGEIFVAAPFIKQSALHRVLSAIPADVPLMVIVRFAPIDIAMGATDSAIVDDLLARPKTQILAQPALHAKLYRVDDRALIGSANLTNKGLGWSSGANVELLIEVPAANEDVQMVESILRETSFPLTPELAAEIVASVTPQLVRKAEETEEVLWLPSCRRPSFLWDIYATGTANVIASVIAAARRDIRMLDLPSHLPKVVFEKAITAAFQASHFYQTLDRRLAAGSLPDAMATQWLLENFRNDMVQSPVDTWAAAKEWLRAFCPETFHFGQYSETTIKATRLR